MLLYLFLVSIAPALFLILYFYHKDKYEKEPLELLLKAFASGLIITFFIIIIELFLSVFIAQIKNYLFKIFLISFLIAALVEEGFKFLAFRFLLYNNKEFDEPYDGIIYLVSISLGFATFESIMYIVYSYSFSNFLYLNITAISRGIFAVPLHAFCGVIGGYYLGLAKFSKDSRLERRYIYKALNLAILTHGLYDFFVFTSIFGGFIFIIILFIFCLRFTKKAIKLHIENSSFKDRYDRS